MPQLSFFEIGEAAEVYQYSVLVTSLDEDTEAVGQLYRDWGDGENIFRRDEDPMGLGAASRRTTWRVAGSRPGCSRCFTIGGTSLSASPTLISTARRSPAGLFFLSAIATRTRHARQTPIRVTSSLANQGPPPRRLRPLPRFLTGLTKTAEQLTRLQIWRATQSRAFQAFLNGRLLRAPPRLAPS